VGVGAVVLDDRCRVLLDFGEGLEAGDDVGTARWFARDELEAPGEELHEDTRALLERAGIL